MFVYYPTLSDPDHTDEIAADLFMIPVNLVISVAACITAPLWGPFYLLHRRNQKKRTKTETTVTPRDETVVVP